MLCTVHCYFAIFYQGHPKISSSLVRDKFNSLVQTHFLQRCFSPVLDDKKRVIRLEQPENIEELFSVQPMEVDGKPRVGLDICKYEKGWVWQYVCTNIHVYVYNTHISICILSVPLACYVDTARKFISMFFFLVLFYFLGGNQGQKRKLTLDSDLPNKRFKTESTSKEVALGT